MSSHRHRRACVFAALVLAFVPSLAAASTASAAVPVTRFVPPVEAPISDPFRPPATPYGPGNRGIEYATEPGTAVRASAAGVVAFAGVIAHERYVSIDHQDGIRTTYSYLATIAVVAGQRVAQGDVVGRSAVRLHFGARRLGAYIDPASLFAPVTTRRGRLVPVSEPRWT